MSECNVVVDGQRFSPDAVLLFPPATVRIHVRELKKQFASLVQPDRFLILYCEELDLESPPLRPGEDFEYHFDSQEGKVIIFAVNQPKLRLQVQLSSLFSQRSRPDHQPPRLSTPVKERKTEPDLIESFRKEISAEIRAEDFTQLINDSPRRVVIPQFDRVVLEEAISPELKLKPESEEDTSGSQENRPKKKRRRRKSRPVSIAQFSLRQREGQRLLIYTDADQLAQLQTFLRQRVECARVVQYF